MLTHQEVRLALETLGLTPADGVFWSLVNTDAMLREVGKLCQEEAKAARAENAALKAEAENYRHFDDCPCTEFHGHKRTCDKCRCRAKAKGAS